MRILLLRPRSTYDLMRDFAERLRQGIAARGHEVLAVDMTNPGRERAIAAALAARPVAVVGFNATAPDELVHEGGHAPWDLAGVPLYNLLVDDPLVHWTQLAPGWTSTEDMTVLCIDREHAGAVRRDLGLRHRAGYLPHGGSDADRAVAPALDDAERPIDVLFPGTWITTSLDPGALGSAPEPARSIVALATERVTEEGVSARGLAREALRARGLAASPALLWAARDLLIEVDRWLRGQRRLAVLRSLAAAGLRVVVLGERWEQAPPVPGLSVRRPRVYHDVLDLMGMAKSVLHVGPLFWAGLHERPLSAMANGAVAVTELNDEFGDAFDTGHELLGYRLPEVAELGERVRALLADPRRRAATAAAGRARVLDGHLWEHRADALVELVESRSVI